ncbi:MAG: EamA family transporter [Verrucomicrobiota bacterium]
MSFVAIVLVVLSAVVHAGWNLLSKRQHPSAAFFLVASLTGALLLSPALLLYLGSIVQEIPARVWTFLLITGFFLAVYYMALAGAYRAGDISVAYPLARSSPVIVVSVVTLMLGRGDQVSPLCVGGIILVVGGCFLIPLQRFRDLRLMNYLNPTCALALLAAVGTSGYSIVDDEALRQLRTYTQSTIGNTQMTLVYACLEALSASLWLFLFVTLRRSGRASLSQVLRVNKPHAALAGVAIYLAYVLVLIALAFANNVSYVVGFRQLSIPLGATLGVLVLKEAPTTPKIAGVIIVFVGLMLVAMG